MGRLPDGETIWSLRRYVRDKNLWDHVCIHCKQATPVFEYEYRDEQKREAFNYLCESCAQNLLGEWLQRVEHLETPLPGRQIDFDIAHVFYEQKNDEETLILTRWSPEQRRHRLQNAEE